VTARIALFAPYLPAPAFSGGRIRIHRLAQGLAELGELVLFAQAGTAEARAARGASELEPYRGCFVAKARPALPGLFTASRAARGMPAALGRAFAREHAERPFALAVVEHSHAARYALGAGIPVLLDEHNVESAYRRAAVDARGGLVRAALGRRDAALLAHWERRVWQAADRVVCVTEDDARAIAAVRGEPPAVVPNGVDTGKVPFVPPSSRTGSEILFVGLMDHPPNVRAAERLAREVMPRVWAARAAARLVLCGANPAREVRALASERVLVTGRVPEVAPYLSRARAVCVPLAHGAGSSLKVLEALASGAPLVASSTAVRGFRLEPGRHFLHAETPEAAAQSVLEALDDGARFDAMAAAGREIAEAHDWTRLAQRFAELARSLLGAAPRAALTSAR